jgi:membrane protein YdbS with pleckstrin-like domain
MDIIGRLGTVGVRSPRRYSVEADHVGCVRWRSIVVVVMVDQDVDGGEPSWNVPSPRLRVLRRREVGATTLVLVVVAVGATLAVGAPVAAVASLAGLILAGAVADAVAGRRVRAWGYAERADDLLVRRGVMFRRMSVIPYGRMQYVEVTAGPLERAFGLATVQMHTAAAASDARIPGLPSAEAARLRDQLTSLGEAQATGL